jgi:thioredoxin reductase
VQASERVDVVIIGGGPAGLAAALWLGRHRFRTVVADRGEHRNRHVDATFGYLGFDGAAPAELLAAGRRDLERYPDVRLLECGARSVHRHNGEFAVELDDGVVAASALIFATGVRDAIPPLPGLRHHYGKAAFVCPLCDGYEVRGQRVAVLGAGGTAGAFAAEMQQWASDVTIVPLGEERPDDELQDSTRLATAPAVAIVGTERVERVELADGSSVECDALFLRSETRGVTDLAAHLGCETDDEGLLVVDADGQTSVQHVYAAGDCTPGPQIVQLAAAEGARAGLHCAQTLMAMRQAS